MATHISWVLQKAITERLLQEETLNDKVHFRIYDVAPPSPFFPYIILGQDSIRSWNTKTFKGNEVQFTLHVFSRDTSRKEIKDIIQRILNTFENRPLYLEDNYVVHLMPELVQTFVENDRVTCHGIIKLHAITVNT